MSSIGEGTSEKASDGRHRVERDRLLLRRSFFDEGGKKLPPLHGMKVGKVP
jgi:hypothetical protein